MHDRWFFTHGGLTLGPVASQEITKLAAAGQLGPHEHVWPEGFDVQMTVQAFLGMAQGGTLPDWLGDAESAEASRPRPPQPPPATKTQPKAAAQAAAPERWYYLHNRWTYGPVSLAELKKRASYGQLDGQDPVWREGGDPKVTVPASSVVEFLKAKQTPGGWLAGGQAPKPAAAPAAPSRPTGAPAAPKSGGGLDWLDDVRASEGPAAPARGAPAAPQGLATQPPKQGPAPTAAPTRGIATPMPKQAPVSPPAPARNMATPMPRPQTPAAAAPRNIRTPAPRPPSPPKKEALPPPSRLPLDWLEDIREIEQSLRGAAPAAPRPSPTAPPAGRQPAAPGARPVTPFPVTARPATPTPANNIEVIAIPLPPGTPSPPSDTVAPVATPRSPASPPPRPPAAPPAARAPAPPAPSAPAAVAPAIVAMPVPSPAPAVPATTPASAPAEAATPEEMGFNPDTGQILNAEVFARWQRAEQEKKDRALAAQPEVTIYEVFLRARWALQDWVDAEHNKPLIVSADLDAIKQDPQVQQLVCTYQGYGDTMIEKLWKHFGFLVENRRKFYAAFA